MTAVRRRDRCGTLRRLAAGVVLVASVASAQTSPGVAVEQAGSPGARSVLWDNGDTNGVNGVSHLGSPRRSVLDDFVVPDGTGWDITGFVSRHVWQTLRQPSATGYQLAVWSDADGRPGEPIAFMATTAISEGASGRVWMGRPEMDISASFATVRLEPGVYWLEMHVVGPENCFQLVHDLGGLGSPCWVNYQDIGGLRPGYEVYFADYDVSFSLLGEPSGCGLGDCNADGAIDTRDFICYLALWAAGDPAAECNGDLGIDTPHFLCFLDRWSAGC